jgi:hypothetical protein
MRYFNVFLLIVVFLFSSGCAGYRVANLEETENGIKHRDTNISILEPSVYPTDMARAKEILSQAEINKAMAEQIRSGQSANIIGGYTGVVINESVRETFYFNHPTRSTTISIPPGGKCVFIKSTKIPDRISGRFASDDEIDRFRIYKEAGTYNGVKVDYGTRAREN